MSRTLRTFFAALATAVAAFYASSASATVWHSGFDPVGTVTFSGDAFFQFDDACLAPDGFHDAATCNLEMTSAEIDMTDTGTGDTAHLSFASVVPWFVTGDLVTAGGDLVGLDTDQIGPAFVSAGGSLDGPWWIQWTSSSDGIGLPAIDPVFLFFGECNDGCFPDGLPSGEAIHVTFDRVPEPGTLGLILGGVGAAWLARRRKRAN
jgi:PEP-CTERM motif